MFASMSAPNFQEMIALLERYWADDGCVLVQPYHTEVGAGTFNPATFLRCLGPSAWKAAYVEPSIRPSDGRYGENPFRFQHYYQYQVVLKPAPEDVLDRYFASLEAVGIDLPRHDVRLVEDDWEGPTLGAWGLGWEVWVDGMEVTQFTYFQQLGGMDVDVVSGEITYGLERNLPLPAYDQALKASHALNLLDARGAISVTEPASYTARVRDRARSVA